MDADLRRLAVARALAYLERCGTPPEPAVRSRVERLVDEAMAGGPGGALDRVFGRLAGEFPEAADPDSCVCPPIHRASMGYPEP